MAPYQTPYQTLYQTLYQTPYRTLYQTPYQTLYQTLYQIPYQNSYQTFYRPLYQTFFMTFYQIYLPTYWEPIYLPAENLPTCVLRIYLPIYWEPIYLINDRVVTEPYFNRWKVFKLYSNSQTSSWTHRAMKNEPSISWKSWKWCRDYCTKARHGDAIEITLDCQRDKNTQCMSTDRADTKVFFTVEHMQVISVLRLTLSQTFVWTRIKITNTWQKYRVVRSDVLPVGCVVIQRVPNPKGLSSGNTSEVLRQGYPKCIHFA